MNLFIMGARSPTGRNPKPATFLFGLRISRTCETSDRSISLPSLRRCQHPEAHVHSNGVFSHLHKGVA